MLKYGKEEANYEVFAELQNRQWILQHCYIRIGQTTPRSDTQTGHILM